MTDFISGTSEANTLLLKRELLLRKLGDIIRKLEIHANDIFVTMNPLLLKL